MSSALIMGDSIGIFTAPVNGYLTGCPAKNKRSSYRPMDLAKILERIDRRLVATGETANSASRQAGKTDAIRNLQRAVKDGTRAGISTATIAALAPVLKTSSAWLIDGEGPEEIGQDAANAPAIKPVPVWGKIGAGGSIDTAWEQQAEPLFEIAIPFATSDDAVGFEISGDSMYPKYDDGDVIIVDRRGESIEGLADQEAAVRVSDGGRYFKRILHTPTHGLYDLESYNAPMMRNVQIAWASGLIARIPAKRWRRMNGKLK